MNRTGFRRTAPALRAAGLALAGLALILLAGCHYSLLNGSASLAAWSPDGTRLAVCIGNHSIDSGELWLVEPQGGSATKLLTAGMAKGLPHLLAPRWSPDGKRLYCVRTTGGEESDRRPAVIVGIDLASGTSSDIGTIHYTGSRGSWFTETGVLAAMADGTLAAQDLGTDEICRLVRIHPVSGAVSPFPAPEGRWMTINGSPQGDLVAVAVPGPEGSGARITFHRDTGERLPSSIQLWDSGGNGSRPSLCWSPAGDRLAVVVEDIPPEGSRWSLPAAQRPREGEEGNDFATLLIVDPHSGESVTVAHDVFGLPPVFSPDGRRLAYAASSGIRDGDGDLLLEVRLQGNGLGQDHEVSIPGLALPLAWSTDGIRLAYYLGLPDDDNRGTIISVAADGTGTTAISIRQQDRLAVHAPCGGLLAWVSGDGAIQVLDPGTGRLIYANGLTATGAIQTAEDHLHQGRPQEALRLLDAVDPDLLDGRTAARLAAVSHAALYAAGQPGAALERLQASCDGLARTADPAAAFLALCGALSDLGFRPEAQRLVEERLLATYPDSPEAVEALWALAALKQSEGDADSALRHLERLFRGYPGERSETTRALLLAALADAEVDPLLLEELAQMVLEASSQRTGEEANVSIAAARFTLGAALERQGRVEESRESYTAVLAGGAEALLPDGRSVLGLSRQAIFRMACGEVPAARR